MIDLRAALILLTSAVSGTIATALRLAAGSSWPNALLTGGAAFGATLGGLLHIIE